MICLTNVQFIILVAVFAFVLKSVSCSMSKVRVRCSKMSL